MQFLAAVLESPFVCRVDDPDESVRRLEVVAPIRTQALLAAHVPDIQVEPKLQNDLFGLFN